MPKKWGEILMDHLHARTKTIFVLALLIISSLIVTASSGSDPDASVSSLPVFGGGYLKWSIDAVENDTSALSTPALADLDNDGLMEIIAVTANGTVNVLTHHGWDFWSEPFELGEMDLLGEEEWATHGIVQPPEFFPSPLVADVVGSDSKELIVAGGDGLYCIGANGSQLWKYDIPNGSIFNTPSLVDLEGAPEPSNEDMEIIFARDNENETTELVILKGDGSIVVEQNISHSNERLLEVTSSIIAEDLDGTFWDGGVKRVPSDGEDKDMELLVERYEYIEVYKLNNSTIGPSGGYTRVKYYPIGHYGISTPALVNTDNDRELEIIFTENRGLYSEWGNWQGAISTTDQDLSPDKVVTLASSRSGIIGSPAVGDLQGTAYEDWTGNDLEIVFGSVNGMLYVFDANLLWESIMQFDTGGPIISSPALCDIDFDRELEIIVASESGQIFCLDGDPSDGIDEGVPYPGDHTHQDVLWVYDAGTTFGISSPVVADIDDDGVLEVLIGTTDGRLICLSAGGRALRGQIEWPTFHGNNRRTGYYYEYPTKWVGIGPGIDEITGPEQLVKSIHPGSSVVFNLSVELEGQGITEPNREKIFVRVEQDSVPDGWTAWLDTPADRGNDNPDYVRLASSETASLRLWVFAPWSGERGDMARIVVEAFLETDEDILETISCIAVLDLFNDFELFYLRAIDTDVLSPLEDRKWDKINPGAEGLYTISIINKGNMNDTYDITLNHPPIEAGWNWYFLETGGLNVSVSLTAQLLVEYFGGVSGATFTVVVEAPYNATRDSRIPILLKGVSRNIGSSDPETDILYLVVGERNGLEMFVDQEVYYCYPDQTMTFSLGMKNTGNKDVINVLLSVEGKISGWYVKFPEEPIPIFMGQTKWVPVTIRAPNWARANSNLVLNMIGVIEAATSITCSVNITVIVPAITGIGAYIETPEDIELDPGGSLNCTLKISSRSNFNETILLEPIIGDPDLKVEVLDAEGNEVNIMDLGIYELRELIVKVTAGEGAIFGSYSITIRLTPLVNVVQEINFSVNVTLVGELEVNFLDHGKTIEDSAPIQNRKLYTIEVVNKGNGPDSVSMSMGKFFYLKPLVMVSLEDGWHASFFGVSLSREQKLEEIIVSNLSGFSTTELSDSSYYRLETGMQYPSIYHDIGFVLAKGDTAYVDLVVWGASSDGSYMVNDIHLEILTSSIGRSDHSLLSLDIELLYPDLCFDEFEYSIYDENGYNIDIIPPGVRFYLVLEVFNQGETASGITHIELTSSGAKLYRVDIGSIQPGQGRELTIPMKLPEGEHVIVLVIDPDNTVHESADQFMFDNLNNNNRMVIMVSVGNEADDGSSTMLYIASGLIALILFMSLMLVILIRPWNKFGKGPENEDGTSGSNNESVQ